MSRYAGTSLQDLAASAGFTKTSLASVLRLDRATIYRLWNNPHWLDEAQVATLMQLATCIPGVPRAIELAAIEPKLIELSNGFGRHGYVLNTEAIQDSIVAGFPSTQYTLTALMAALNVLRADTAGAVRHLRPLWGREQNLALEMVYGTAPTNRLFEDTAGILKSSSTMINELMTGSQLRFDRAVAIAQLAHHSAKAGFVLEELVGVQQGTKHNARERNLSFAVRGATMGAIRSTDDTDLVDRYDHRVRSDGLVFMVEQWAFPTWAGDAWNGEDFDLPRHMILANTAAEILREIREYNEAYLYYLTRTYIPLALERVDPTFGGRLHELASTLGSRMEHLEARKVKVACQQLLVQIQRNG